MTKDKNMTLAELAAQLQTPSGELGIEVAEMMNVSNIGMTRAAFKYAGITEDMVLLEVGHGSALHLAEMVGSYPRFTYAGLELSQLMYEQAILNNQKFINSGIASFAVYDGEKLPYPNEVFDRILTINTIYFWNDPAGFAAELFRVLMQKGSVSLAFAQKSFMKDLPFTQYGFRLYDKDEAKQLFLKAGFSEVEFVEGTDHVQSKDNPDKYVDRKFLVLLAQK